jgi:hypothetical protein
MISAVVARGKRRGKHRRRCERRPLSGMLLHIDGSAAETERMMKLQDVLPKAMAKKIRWWDGIAGWGPPSASSAAFSKRTVHVWIQPDRSHTNDQNNKTGLTASV